MDLQELSGYEIKSPDKKSKRSKIANIATVNERMRASFGDSIILLSFRILLLLFVLPSVINNTLIPMINEFRAMEDMQLVSKAVQIGITKEILDKYRPGLLFVKFIAFFIVTGMVYNVIFICYFKGSFKGQTVGMKAANIKFQNLDGTKPSALIVALRYLVSLAPILLPILFLSMKITYDQGGISILYLIITIVLWVSWYDTMLFSQDRRAVPDYICRTVIVRVKFDKKKNNKKDNNEADDFEDLEEE